MQLLDIYQDLLSTRVQAPEPVESAADKFGEQANDRALVHSFISRLNEHSPPEPGTSQSHAMDVGSQEPVTNCRQAVSRLAAAFQDQDTTMEHPDHSSSNPSPLKRKTMQPILPSSLERAAITRECVGTSQDKSVCADLVSPDPCKRRGICYGISCLDEGSLLP